MKQAKFNGENYSFYDFKGLVDTAKDMAYHNGQYQNESWFIVSNLESNGDRIGLQVHGIIQRTIISLNISVINETRGLYKSYEYAFQSGKNISVSNDKFEIQTDDFFFGGDTTSITTKLKIPGASIDIASKNVAETLFINGQGYFDFVGAKQFDFAFPRMETSGIITIDDHEFPIKGITWFDRQWGDLPNPAEVTLGEEAKKTDNPYEQVQWIWFNPQLSNGISFSFGEIVIMVAKKYTGGVTVVYPDGTHYVSAVELVERHDFWESPATGNKYPTRFIMKIPHNNAELEIVVPYKEQEIVSEVGGITKFEGMANISGVFDGEEVTGEGYVELVGNWK